MNMSDNFLQSSFTHGGRIHWEMRTSKKKLRLIFLWLTEGKLVDYSKKWKPTGADIRPTPERFSVLENVQFKIRHESPLQTFASSNLGWKKKESWNPRDHNNSRGRRMILEPKISSSTANLVWGSIPVSVSVALSNWAATYAYGHRRTDPHKSGFNDFEPLLF